MSKVLMIVTSHSELGDTGNKTGVWLEEFTTPFYALTDAGHDVTVATLGGRRIPIDPNSEPSGDDEPDSVKRFRNDSTASVWIEGPTDLATHDPNAYDGIFIPGGHGAMWDLASSDELAKFLSTVWANGKILASVCHGPAALVNVKDENGNPVVKGRKVSAFTDSEEESTGLVDAMPFLLESKLRELGADFQGAPDWQSQAVEDGRLITGQNPMSSEKVAELLTRQLA
ncbi:type 1 glutamine amidotransferase domain-containing protein [Roseivivax sp. CAU 1761]